MPLISVIVPVYNAEPYLARCIESILSQQFVDFELLLIDDCSADNSASVCQSYASQDSRIRFYQNETNQGVSDTRNRGIEESSGDYITFIDDDDFVEQSFLQTFVDSKLLSEEILLTQQAIYNVLGKDKSILKGNDILGCPWAKLFSKSIITEYHIQFIPNILFAEDSIFCFEYISHVHRVAELPFAFYHWILNTGSTSLKRDTDYDAISYGMLRLSNMRIGYTSSLLLQDYVAHHIALHYHKLIKALYQYSTVPAKQRYACLKTVNSDAYIASLYPVTYRSDRLIRWLMQHRLIVIADRLNIMLWYIRKHHHS